MLTLIERLPANADVVVSFTLALSAEERTKSRHRFETEDGQTVFLRLPRGTVLRDGDLLQAETDNTLVRVTAKPEPVLTITSRHPLDLLRAAYHLGNRHVPLMLTPTALYFEPDHVLAEMVTGLGLQVDEVIHPFEPESGAYAQHQHDHRLSPIQVIQHVRP